MSVGNEYAGGLEQLGLVVVTVVENDSDGHGALARRHVQSDLAGLPPQILGLDQGLARCAAELHDGRQRGLGRGRRGREGVI